MNYVNFSECSWELSKDRKQVIIAAPDGHRICPRSMRLAEGRLASFADLHELTDAMTPLLQKEVELETICNVEASMTSDRSSVFWRIPYRRLCRLLSKLNEA